MSLDFVQKSDALNATEKELFLGCLLYTSFIIALHDIVSAGAELARLVRSQRFAGFRVYNFNLYPRHRAAHRIDTVLYAVVRGGHGANGRRLGLSKGCLLYTSFYGVFTL